MADMTLAEARKFAATLPWRKVKSDAPGSQMDPHWYVITGWREVDAAKARRFEKLIQQRGYLGRYVRRYAPEEPLYGRYLTLGDGFVYWAIPPNQLCRTPESMRQHAIVDERTGEVLAEPPRPPHRGPEQLRIEVEGSEDGH